MLENSFIKQFVFNPASTTANVEFKTWKDKEIPKTIYKYRNWGNKYHRRLITNMELYFPRPQELNDPFDCQRNFNWEELMDLEKQKRYLEVAEKRLETNPFYSEEEKRDIISRGRLQKMDEKRVKEMEEYVREQDDMFNSLVGTFTASLIKDSILLWSHYCNSHTGFCVGLDTELLLTSIKHLAGAKTAQYDPKLEVSSMLDDIEEAISEKTFKKYDTWAYEFEYRILAGQLSKNKVFPPPETFKEIIFGINMPKNDRTELIYKARKRMPTVKFYEAKKARNEYRIEIVEIG